jgi:hypothetical protein
MEKSIIFFTSQTSGSGSMKRIYEQFTRGRFLFNRIVREFYRENRMEDLSKVIPNPFGEFIYLNAPRYFNKRINVADYRFIVNFRDPRDRLCNMYYWKFVHPRPGRLAKETAGDAPNESDIGIDAWVLNNIDAGYFDVFFWLLEQLTPDQFIVQSYSKLCLGFDAFIRDAAKFLDVSLTPGLIELVEPERTENLVNNPNWIGQKWPGADIAPGRYKEELQPETIKKLTRQFDNALRLMAQYDPEYSYTYVE